jgi:hypothetical protein
LSKITLIEQDDDIKQIEIKGKETKFWKDYSCDGMEITTIKSCKKCLGCVTCKSNMAGQSEEEMIQTKLLNENTKFDYEKKKWTTKYMYNEDVAKKMEDNLAYVKRHMEKFHQKMAKFNKEDRDIYNSVLDKGIEMGSFVPAESCPELQGLKKRGLPMNYAYSGKPESCKIRTTWDASSTCSKTDSSFNQATLRGPIHMNLHRSMLWMRSRKFFNSLDIVKAYFNIIKDERSQSLGRMFLPIKEGKIVFGDLSVKLTEFVSRSCIFGELPAPGALEMAVKKATVEFGMDPEVAEMVKKIMYSDDLGVAHNKMEGIVFAMKEVARIAKESNWETHDWFFPLENQMLSTKPTIDEINVLKEEKVLGYHYCRDTDMFYLKVKINLSKRKRGLYQGKDLESEEDIIEYLKKYGLTRRLFLSTVAGCWDIGGDLAVIQVNLRLAFRETVIEENAMLSWDDQLSSRAVERFSQMLKMLLRLDGYSWKRCLIDKENIDIMIEDENYPALATIYDASNVAAAATAYLVTRYKGIQHNFVSLVLAKTKLCSVQGSTIPRMELISCYLGSVVQAWLKENLPIKINRYFMIGDSTTVLSQVKNKAVLFKAFEQTRIRIIQNVTEPNQFFYTKSANNAADLATRFNTNITREMLDSDRWKKGIFLTEEISKWPIVKLEDINPQDKIEIPGSNSKYKEIQLSTIKVFDENDLNEEVYEDFVNIEDIDVVEEDEVEAETELWSLLGKKKQSMNAYQAKKRQMKIDTRSRKLGFVKTAEHLKEQLENGDPEKPWTPLLQKHRNYKWSVRVLSYVMKFVHTKFNLRFKNLSTVEMIEKAEELLLINASLRTKVYLNSLTGIHDVLFEDNLGIVRVENRMFEGSDEVPRDSIVIANDTELAKAILRDAHDNMHSKHSRSIRSILRTQEKSLYIPRCIQFLNREDKNCPRCILFRGLRMQVKTGKVPKERHHISDPWSHCQIDIFGPVQACSLLRNDRRKTKAWILAIVCKISGLLHLEMLADSTNSSVVIALDTFKSQVGTVHSITLDPATNFKPMEKFNDDNDSDDEGNANQNDRRERISSLEEFGMKSNIKIKVSPPKHSSYQNQVERYIGLIKTMLSFQYGKELHILEWNSNMKKCAYILNTRPVCMNDNGEILSRFDLLKVRARNGTQANIFSKETPMIDAGQFAEHIEIGERMIDDFWTKFRTTTIENMMRTQHHRFPGEIIPKIEDIVGVPDRTNREGGVSIGRIKKIKRSNDGEARVCLIEVARRGGKKSKDHPFPLENKTTVLAEFERHAEDLIFLMRPNPRAGLSGVFLYEDIYGLPADEVKDEQDEQDEEVEEDEEYDEERNQAILRELLEDTKQLKETNHQQDETSDDDEEDN